MPVLSLFATLIRPRENPAAPGARHDVEIMAILCPLLATCCTVMGP
jgi:hypothetical protein